MRCEQEERALVCKRKYLLINRKAKSVLLGTVAAWKKATAEKYTMWTLLTLVSLVRGSIRKRERVERKDPVASWLKAEIPNPEQVILEKPQAEKPPHRVCAERAITEFESLNLALSEDKAKEAYIHLLVPRGFDQASALQKTEARQKISPSSNAAGASAGDETRPKGLSDICATVSCGGAAHDLDR